MISLKEKLPELNETPEKNSSLSKRVKIALMRTAVHAMTLSGKNLGPQGKHNLHDNNYHNSAQRYIEEANITPEDRERLQRSGRYRGSVEVGDLQEAIGERPEVVNIAQDSRYLYTHPDSKYSHTPNNRH